MEKKIIIDSIPSKLYIPDTSGRFLYIRHGETQYNIDSENIEYNVIKTMSEYIDCPLTENGKQQAKNCQSLFNSFDIEQIFVSPLYRALQTASILFENHPNKKNINIKIHPLLTEIVSGVHNFTYEIQKHKLEFNENSNIKFDWSIFDEYYNTAILQDLFFLNFIDRLNDQEKKEQFDKIYFKYGKNEIKESVANLSKYVVEKNIKYHESVYHLFLRNIEFKNFLKKNFKNDNVNNNKKIIVVTHNCFCMMGTSKDAYKLTYNDEDNFPEDRYDLQNCEVISMLI